MKQCFFVDMGKNTNFGILTDDGNIICLECGGVLEPDVFRLLEVYDTWYNLEYYALCDCEEARDKWDTKFESMTQEEFDRWFDNA